MSGMNKSVVSVAEIRKRLEAGEHIELEDCEIEWDSAEEKMWLMRALASADGDCAKDLRAEMLSEN